MWIQYFKDEKLNIEKIESIHAEGCNVYTQYKVIAEYSKSAHAHLAVQMVAKAISEDYKVICIPTEKQIKTAYEGNVQQFAQVYGMLVNI